MKIERIKDYIKIEIDLNIYNTEVLHKCFYWYLDKFSVEINLDNPKSGIIKLFPKSITIGKIDINQLSHKIRNDLIDFNLRDIVTKETKNIRELIIARAFSESDNDELTPHQIIQNPMI
jgi:His-Xaa-Ser system protein HxsD